MTNSCSIINSFYIFRKFSIQNGEMFVFQFPQSKSSDMEKYFRSREEFHVCLSTLSTNIWLHGATLYAHSYHNTGRHL